MKVDSGKLSYDEVTKVCVWEVGTFGATSPKLTGTMKLEEAPDGVTRLERLPLTVHFRVPKATVSGLEVANMLGESETYKSFRGVQAVVKSGKYQLRV